MPHFVYVLLCADHTYYVGNTADVRAREEQHNDGRGGRYTSCRRPVCVVYSEAHDTLAGAVKRERQLKGWSKAKKAALVTADIERLRTLSRRRTGK